jgi:MoaA/NifB/PqqE/SkfB family radical SAM enzyme
MRRYPSPIRRPDRTAAASEIAMKTFHPSSQQHADYEQFDQGRPRGAAHAAFQRRLEASRLTTAYFTRLERLLRSALVDDPGQPRLAYELACTMLQNRPDVERLAEARRIIHAVEPQDPTTSQLVGRLSVLIAQMEGNAARNTRSYRPKRVNWAVNNECPMVCKGCYNPFTADQLTSSEALAVLDQLASHDVPAIMVSGGDPLLWKPLFAFLDEAARHGIEIGLDTTGYTLDDALARRLAARVGTVGIGVDGSTERIHGLFRLSSNRDLLGRALDALHACDRAGVPHVRVHTVVSRRNVEDLPAVAALIGQFSCVQQWALFQWWGRRASSRIRAAMEVTDEEFVHAVEGLGSKPRGMEVLPYRSARRAFTNLFIQNNGQVMTFGEEPGEEFIVGNLREETFEDVLVSPAVYQHGLVEALVGHGYADDIQAAGRN